MKRLPLLVLAGLSSQAGCPSSDSASNPPVLWLALDGSEVKTRLIDHEPKPF